MKISKLYALFLTLTIVTALTFTRALADNWAIDFESPTYTTGTIHLQDGWSASGSAGSGCALYDHAVVSNTFGYATFGAQSLRISNAVTSGCFGDQTFSKSLVDEAGESTSSDAFNGGYSGGTRQSYFEAEWDFASTVPGAEQVGLSTVASPDRGDGARMSWVQMTDTPAGLQVNFYDYQISADPPTGDFVFTNVASGLDRTIPHRIKITMDFVDGAENDVVKIYVDGTLFHTGTSWEDYFRQNQPPGTRTVDSILFRTGGTAAPATSGYGFLIDNLSLLSGADTTPPVVTVPSDMTEEATSASGATVNFVASATDETDPPTPAVTCVPASGSTFALGTTPVTCSAPDTAGNTGYGYFNVTVEDTTDPVLSVPADITVPESSPGSGSAVVNFTVTASDIVDASPTVICAPASGSSFALGTTAVNCSAEDNYSNFAYDNFNVIVRPLVTTSFRSVGIFDGHILESSENSSAGGATSVSGTSLFIGDATNDRQYLSLLHFDTAGLPDGAVVTGLAVRLKGQGFVGTNPFGTHGNLQVDIASPYFGINHMLALADFQALADALNVGAFNPVPAAGSLYTAILNPAAFPFVDLLGPTQLRLGFSLGDNDDYSADYMKFYSGNYTTASYRPQFIVIYYVP